MKIQKAYKENNITIPFPVKTLDFKSNNEFNLDDFPKPNEDKNN